jgi:small subunit ribosomal protein S3
MVIGRKGKIIKELQKQLDERFGLENPRLKVDEVEDAALNAQVMAEKIASAMERGWYYRRAGHSAALNIMEAGARGVIITLAGKLTGSKPNTEVRSWVTSSTVVKPLYSTWMLVTQLYQETRYNRCNSCNHA